MRKISCLFTLILLCCFESKSQTIEELESDENISWIVELTTNYPIQPKAGRQLQKMDEDEGKASYYCGSSIIKPEYVKTQVVNYELYLRRHIHDALDSGILKTHTYGVDRYIHIPYDSFVHGYDNLKFSQNNNHISLTEYWYYDIKQDRIVNQIIQIRSVRGTIYQKNNSKRTAKHQKAFININPSKHIDIQDHEAASIVLNVTQHIDLSKAKVIKGNPKKTLARLIKTKPSKSPYDIYGYHKLDPEKNKKLNNKTFRKLKSAQCDTIENFITDTYETYKSKHCFPKYKYKRMKGMYVNQDIYFDRNTGAFETKINSIAPASIRYIRNKWPFYTMMFRIVYPGSSIVYED